MFKYFYIFIFNLSFILFSCGEKELDQRITGLAKMQVDMFCDASIYGEACNNPDDFVLVKKEELKPENILVGSKIGGIEGSYVAGSKYEKCDEDNKVGCIATDKYRAMNIEPYLDSVLSDVSIQGQRGRLSNCELDQTNCYVDENEFIAVESNKLISSNIRLGVRIGNVIGDYDGGYSYCSEDGEVACIATETYKALNINHHKDKIIGSANIFGVRGSFILPSQSSIIQSETYGVAGNLSGTLPYCQGNDSECYIKHYSSGISGSEFKALNYDDINSKKSYIKNGYTLISGITGSQSLCSSAGSSNCYINGEDFKAVESNKLIANNIKHDISLGGVSGSYTGNYLPCSLDSHTSCIAVSEYPSVPAGITSSLLSSVSVNGTPGSIESCSAGGSLCYIDGNTYTAVESNKLLEDNIKHGVSLGGVTGTDVGDYVDCSSDESIGCIATSTYKAIDINNHTDKIISTQSIAGITGTYVVPPASVILESSSYGVGSSLSGTVPYCSVSGSGCYIKPYSKGVDGYTLKALDYDDISSKTSYIKNGYELVSGVVGTQGICSIGGYDCYIDSSFKAVDSDTLVATNIKYGTSIGGVSGSYNGDSPSCSNSVHTGCIADSTYPSVPVGISSSLLSSVSVNGIPGSIGTCSVGDNSCYIDGNTYTAVESNKLIADNIKHDISLGGVAGSYTGDYLNCDSDGSTGCIATSTYKAIDINNHTDKIISTQSIAGITGTYVVPPASVVLSSSSYGVGSSLSGTVPNCSASGSGCYLKPYVQGVDGYTLKALDYDDMYSKRSYIKNGYTLVYGIEGTQTNCVAGGFDCYIDSNFKAAESLKLVASNIKNGVSLAGVSGSYTGDYSNCSVDGSSECIVTEDGNYRAIDINNHRSKIISTQSIAGIFGTYVVPNTSDVLPMGNYGINGSLVGSINYCDTPGDSGCYLNSYEQGEQPLQALNYDDINSNKSYVKNGYEIIDGIVGTQSICSSSNYNCYINSNDLIAAESAKLIASNIKHDITLGGVTGNYSGDYSSCTSESHTDCLADSSYPSVPAGIRSSLLSSVSVNGTPGSIGNCSAGGSRCYINGDGFKAVESSKLIAANIKSGVLLGMVAGSYNGDYSSCTNYIHTSCIADSSYPSVPVGITSSLLSSVSVNGTPGSIGVCDSGDSSCYISSNSLKAVESSLLLASNIKKDVVIGEVTGAYPSSTYPLVADTNTVDLTGSNFNSLIVSEDPFEWFDSSGARHTGSGDEDLVAGNIRKDVEVFGVTGTYGEAVMNDMVDYGYSVLIFKKKNRTVTCIGSSMYGGDCSSVSGSLVNIKSVHSTHNGAFAALKYDGSIVTWGYGYGGDPEQSDAYATAATGSLDHVKKIYSNPSSFAVINEDGSVDTWGETTNGGNSSSPIGGSLSSGVISIYSTDTAYAALKENGTVVTWGDSYNGGDSNSVQSQLNNVVSIASNSKAFTAIKKDGTVVTWGNINDGGGTGGFDNGCGTYGGDLSNVIDVVGSKPGGSHMYGSFAAIKADGTVVTWGCGNGGDSSSVQLELTGVRKIFSNGDAFAALKSDKTVVSWGASLGDYNTIKSSLVNVVDIVATNRAFAARTGDGAVIVWGDSNYGGAPSNAVKEELEEDIVGVYATDQAFAALKEDGSVVAWGDIYSGGDSSAIQEYTGASTISDITTIFSGANLFIGIREDDTYIVWGTSY